MQRSGPHGNAGYSNAGLIVGPDHCVVVDTLGTNPMHDAFQAAIRTVTSKPVGRVLLTHHHVDHVLGTHRFMPACVISHRACRAHMAEGQAGMAERWAAKRPHFSQDLRGIPAVLPDLTFDDRVYLHLGQREMVFFHPGQAHTDGDAALWLPDCGVLFTGDLFFNRVCPAAFAGSLSGWIRAVEDLLAMDAKTIVPGHGPVAGPTELRAMLDYLRLILAASAEGMAAGVSEEEVARSMNLGEFGWWADTEERLLEDIKRAYVELRT